MTRKFLTNFLAQNKSTLKKILYSSLDVKEAKNTDNNVLWSSKAEFDQIWKNRISVMASYIDIPGAVADFGCGLMWLETFLKPENSYIPIDYIRRDERTIVIDLNNKILTEINADIAFLSGVLEYVREPKTFINYLTNLNCKKIILSYCTLEKFSDINHRESLNWTSHESIFQILSLFTQKYYLVAIDDINNNTILVFNKKI